MVRIEQALQVAATPPELHDESGVERGCDAEQRSNGRPVTVPAFDRRYERLRDASCSSEVGLPPAAPSPEGAKRETERDEVHEAAAW